MNQNIKTLILLGFLFVLSFFAFNYFVNTNEATDEIPPQPEQLTTTTAVAIEKNKETFDYFEISFDDYINSLLVGLDNSCEKVGSWYSLTDNCIKQWSLILTQIDESKAKYLQYSENARNYFVNNYQNLTIEELENITPIFLIDEKINRFSEQLIEVENVILSKSNQSDNSTVIFLSSDSIESARDIGNKDLLTGCYIDEPNQENDEEWKLVDNVNLRDSKKINYALKIQSEINLDPLCMKNLLFLILNNEKGWTNVTGKGFQLTSVEDSDFVFIFATPEKTDELCYPLETNGIYSCRNESEIIINNFRWKEGAADFGKDIETYRLYLINHEAGHLLGWQHNECPKEGAIAPVMMQQSKGTNGCLPYGWPVYEIVSANFDD
jgi:hypothetical protein